MPVSISPRSRGVDHCPYRYDDGTGCTVPSVRQPHPVSEMAYPSPPRLLGTRCRIQPYRIKGGGAHGAPPPHFDTQRAAEKAPAARRVGASAAPRARIAQFLIGLPRASNYRSSAGRDVSRTRHGLPQPSPKVPAPSPVNRLWSPPQNSSEPIGQRPSPRRGGGRRCLRWPRPWVGCHFRRSFRRACCSRVSFPVALSWLIRGLSRTSRGSRAHSRQLR